MEVACSGVLYRPQQRLDHRGRRCGHHDQNYVANLLVVVDLNANLAEPEGTPQGETIVDDLVVVGLMDMGIHFLPWRKPWLQDGCKYSMQRDGREVRSRTDYILGTDHRLFRDLAVWDT